MPDPSWNPPTGPPNGAPIRAAEARHEIDEAIAAARARDRELRAEIVAIATDRVRASERLEVVGDEVDEALSLAKRALVRSNESARAGQRAEAAKWTAAAQVFALRVLTARDEVAALEARLAAAAERSRRTTSALGENVGRLQAVIAARLPMLSARKAARLQREIDEVVVEITAPTSHLVAEATAAARASAAAAEDEPAVSPVADDDLEREVDIESTDALLAELRTDLGLPDPVPSGPGGDADAVGAPADDPEDTGRSEGGAERTGASEGEAAPTAESASTAESEGGGTSTGGGTSKGKGKGKGAPGRTWPVPATRR